MCAKRSLAPPMAGAELSGGTLNVLAGMVRTTGRRRRRRATTASFAPMSTSTDLPCPRCSAKLTAWSDFRGLLAGCEQCGGLWSELQGLGATVRRPDAQRFDEDRGARVRVDVEGYLRCPRCSVEMDRAEAQDGVVLDHCPEHGWFFDDGELTRLERAFQEKPNDDRAADWEKPEKGYSITAGNVEDVGRRLELERAQAVPWWARSEHENDIVNNHRLSTFLRWLWRQLR